MEWERLSCHVENIRRQRPDAVDILVNVALLHVNRRLDFMAGRGLSSAGWKALLQPFIQTIQSDPSFNPDGDTKKFLYKLAYPVIRDALIFYYKHGAYPIDNIMEYAPLKKMKAKSVDWYYHVF